MRGFYIRFHHFVFGNVDWIIRLLYICNSLEVFNSNPLCWLSTHFPSLFTAQNICVLWSIAVLWKNVAVYIRMIHKNKTFSINKFNLISVIMINNTYLFLGFRASVGKHGNGNVRLSVCRSFCEDHFSQERVKKWSWYNIKYLNLLVVVLGAEKIPISEYINAI